MPRGLDRTKERAPCVYEFEILRHFAP